MQYQPETEKVFMMNNPYTPAFRPVPLTEDHEVQRTRKILMIILAVLLILSMISLIGTIFGFQSMDQKKDGLQNALYGEVVISIVLYIFGLFITYQYRETGLRIFAWLGVIELIILGILIIFLFIVGTGLIFAAAYLSPEQGSTIAIGSLLLIFISLFLLAGSFILTLIIVIFSFKLARLIEANKRLNIQSI